LAVPLNSRIESKRLNIEETLSYIETRLEELSLEKEELKEYQQLDKERRALEYIIHDKELSQASKELEVVEGERKEHSKVANEYHLKLLQLHEELRNEEKRNKQMTSDLQNLQKERSTLEVERQDQIKSRAELELALEDSKNKLQLEKNREVRAYY
jgi:structural maintenance of chromosome 3 (chondroitin sulfate proteoglycan 6)